MEKKIGFIGGGKMAQAMIAGIIQSSIVKPNQIMTSARSNETLLSVKERFNVNITSSIQEVARCSNILFLAVKPNLYSKIIEEINEYVSPDTLVITIAAGIDLAFMENQFARAVKVIRTMPNTPSLVGEGMSALCVNQFVTDQERDEVVGLYNSFGECVVVDEALMDSIPAISGSSPAYVYMFIEALADGGVKQGIPRQQAYKLAAQAVLGAAKMVLETGKHPAELKDDVCTPGGATIEAVSELEKNGFRSAILSAMESCTDKAKALAKK
ncbi:pyrroline-5-carboxylate reductase [Bacillus sp. DJP31]|uniref:pyrroline-5-carboxylate reductase n=1 Tax=Bacillus sp. DJP31 TaxID=3409789 RepID=UPI003BB4CDD8